MTFGMTLLKLYLAVKYFGGATTATATATSECLT